MAIVPDAAVDTTATSAAPPAANATSDTAPPSPPDVATNTPAPAMPVPAAQTAPPTPPKQTFGGGFSQAVKGPQYTTDAQGNTVSSAPATMRSKGGILGAILGGALEGAARGVAAPTPEGGRGKGAAFSAGAEAARKGALEADTRARAIAQKNFENQQAATAAKVKNNMELAETAHITQNMNFEAEEHPDIIRSNKLNNQSAELRIKGAQQKLLSDALETRDTLAKLGIDGSMFTEQSPELTAQIPSAVSGASRVIQNGQRGAGNGVVVYPKAQLEQPLTAPVAYRTYDGAVDKDGVPIPTEHILQPDGKLTANDYLNKAFAGRSQLYQMQQKIQADMTAEQHKAEIGQKNAQATQEKAEAFKAAEEGTLTKKQSDLMGNTSGAGAGAPGTNGDAFLNTLEPGFRGVVEGIGTGRLTYSDRQLFDYKTGLPTATMQAVLRAYPDFQVQNAKTWQKTKDEYMGNGQTAKKVVAYNTAMEHAAAAYDKTNLNALINPLSEEGKARNVDINFVSREIGNAISTGVLPQTEGEQIQAGITSHVPYLAKAALKEAIKLLNDKTGEFQTKFDAGAPSKAVQVPQLMSAKAKSAFDHVQSNGKIPYNENATGQVAPTAQTQQSATADPFFVPQSH